MTTPRYAAKRFEIDAAKIMAIQDCFTGQPRALLTALRALCGKKVKVQVPGEAIGDYLLQHRDEIPEIKNSVYYDDPLRVLAIYGGSLQRHGCYREL